MFTLLFFIALSASLYIQPNLAPTPVIILQAPYPSYSLAQTGHASRSTGAGQQPQGGYQMSPQQMQQCAMIQAYVARTDSDSTYTKHMTNACNAMMMQHSMTNMYSPPRPVNNGGQRPGSSGSKPNSGSTNSATANRPTANYGGGYYNPYMYHPYYGAMGGMFMNPFMWESGL